MILGAAYSIWLLNRISFGVLRTHYFHYFQDVSRRELWVLILLSIVVVWVGIYPNIFLNEMHVSVFGLLEQLVHS
jgi:NADH-quinone oxidoreductase subunit M